MGEPNFHCAICGMEVCMRWTVRGRHRVMPPICPCCEHDYSKGTGKAQHGSFRDRREVVRGLALAEALRCEAARIQWGNVHVHA